MCVSGHGERYAYIGAFGDGIGLGEEMFRANVYMKFKDIVKSADWYDDLVDFLSDRFIADFFENSTFHNQYVSDKNSVFHMSSDEWADCVFDEFLSEVSIDALLS